MFKYEFINSLIENFNLYYDDNVNFDDYLFREDGNTFGYFKENTFIIFDNETDFGIKITPTRRGDRLKFKVFYEGGSRNYLAKIMDYEKVQEFYKDCDSEDIQTSLDKADDYMINAHDLLAYYSNTGLIEAENAIQEIERLFKLFKEYDIDELETFRDYIDWNEEHLTYVAGYENAPFTLEETLWKFSETYRWLEVGVDFISSRQVLVEITSDNMSDFNVKEENSTVNSYYTKAIEELKDYLILHDCKVEYIKYLSSTIFIVDIRNKAEKFKDHKYNIFKELFKEKAASKL